MPSDFPRSPKILKGALVAYQLPDLLPTIIIFQYTPEHLTRSLQARTATGGGRGDAQRTDGPPDETITLSVELDAADQLERQAVIPTAVEFHPVIATLELLMCPSFPVVVANQILAAVGSSVILSEPAPM